MNCTYLATPRPQRVPAGEELFGDYLTRWERENRDEVRARTRVLAEAVEALKECLIRYRWGLATDNNGSDTPHGVSRFLELHVSSVQAGSSAYTHDGCGARRAGIQLIWARQRDGRRAPAPGKVELVVTSLGNHHERQVILRSASWALGVRHLSVRVKGEGFCHPN